MAGVSIKGLVHKSKQATKAVRTILPSGLLLMGDAPVVVNSPLQQSWENLLNDPPVDYSDPNRWRESPDIRPSGFPFCPRQYAMERLGLTMPSTFSVRSNFYTGVGTAVHEVSQNALARMGNLVGHWKCAAPTCKKMIEGPPTIYPKEPCPHCGNKLFLYEELRLEDPKIGLRGHTDGLLLYKGFSRILEIKTAGDEKVTRVKGMSPEKIALLFQNESPWYGYWHQASSYVTLVNRNYPQFPKCTGVQYLVISRDNPANVAAFIMNVPDDSWYERIQKRVLRARRAVQRRILPVGFAKTEMDRNTFPTCQWCDWKKVCRTAATKIPDVRDEMDEPELKHIITKRKPK